MIKIFFENFLHIIDDRKRWDQGYLYGKDKAKKTGNVSFPTS